MKSSTASTLSKRAAGRLVMSRLPGHRLHRFEIHVGADGEARHVERAQRQPAAPGFADAPACRPAFSYRSGWARDEGHLLALRGEAHAVDEMVGVALDMGHAQQRHQRQVLLHADAGPGREILGRHEVARRPSLATRAALRIDL